MLEVKNVTKKYGKITAVDNLSFTVPKGCIFGLLGLNGAGKTSTFRMILGLIDANNGEILINGEKINYKITDTLGYLAEERSLLTKLTVYKQLIFYGTLKSIDADTLDKRIDYWLNYFGILEYKNRVIKELSKGNQQKIQFISAIINNPSLLILDEPFSGLDPINIELFKKVILELKKQGTSIIFSTHRMEHAELFCDKICVLVQGKCVLQGDLQEIKDNYKIKKIIVKGDIDINKILKEDGVEDIMVDNDKYVIKIKDKGYVEQIFKCIAKYDNITLFNVEDPSLNEIFLSVVGGCDE